MNARSRTNRIPMLEIVALLAALGCGTASDEQAARGNCTPDESFECACADGSISAQTCLPSGDALGPCECGQSSSANTGGMPSAGGFVPSSTTGGAAGSGGTSTSGTGASSTDPGTLPPPGGTGAGGGEPTLMGGFGGTPTGDPADGVGGGTCCADGDCICRGEPPTSLTSDDGSYATNSYSLNGVGCIYYPTDAEPPFSAVAISDGYLGTGGCGFAQTSGWGPFYASHGIVAMIVETAGSDQPRTRGRKLLEGIAGFKAENQNSASPLFGKLAGRYGTSGFSMGGGGTTYAASEDPTLLSSVALMSWTPTGQGVTVPTLFTCGSSDGLATCRTHGSPAYNAMPDGTPKMIVTVSSGHAGQPSSGGGMQGAWGLAFQKVFLDGDERWKSVLLSGDYDDTNIQ